MRPSAAERALRAIVQETRDSACWADRGVRYVEVSKRLIRQAERMLRGIDRRRAARRAPEAPAP